MFRAWARACILLSLLSFLQLRDTNTVWRGLLRKSRLCDRIKTLWYFTVTLDPYLFWGFIGFLNKAAKSLIYSYPPECSQEKTAKLQDAQLKTLGFRV